MYGIYEFQGSVAQQRYHANKFWLVVLTILKHMKVNGVGMIPYMMENKIHVPNHQPAGYHISFLITPIWQCFMVYIYILGFA